MKAEQRARRVIRHFRNDFITFARHFEKRIGILERTLPGFIRAFPEFDDGIYLKEHIGIPDFARQMHEIVRHGAESQRMEMLSCCFALNFLKIIDDWVREFSATTQSDIVHEETYSNAMISLRRSYPSLLSAYMDTLVHQFAAGDYISFAITNVGALIDQDDIDVGVICRDESGCESANRILGRLQTQMIRSGLPVHYFLSETIGSNSFAVTIGEYDAFLQRQRSDIVVISQLLGGVYLTGDYRVFSRFEDEVLERYHVGDPTSNYFHESYLFGTVKEISRLISQEYGQDEFNPKHDAYRLIKVLISALKTIFRIRNKNLWQILHELKMLDNQHRQLYERLERSLAFFEVCRVVYQITVAQDDQIISSQFQRNVAKMARIMGYPAARRVMIFFEDYARNLHELKTTAQLIMEKVLVEHLRGSNAGYLDSLHDCITIDNLSFLLFDKPKDQCSAAGFLAAGAREQDSEWLRTVATLNTLHKISSRFFKFHLEKLYQRYPDHIEHLTDQAWFELMIQPRLEAVASGLTYLSKRQALMDFFFLKFVQLGLGRLSFLSLPDFYPQFFHFIDTLFKHFLTICDEHIRNQRPRSTGRATPHSLEDLSAFFITGGHGRGELYNDDIDIIIVCQPRLGRESRGLLNAVINQLKGFLATLGSRLHCFFSDAAGTPFLSVPQLENLIQQRDPAAFPLQSQLLQARFIMGDEELSRQFEDRVVASIYRNPTPFIRQVLERHADEGRSADPELPNIRDDAGGIAEISLAANALKVRFAIPQTNSLSVLWAAESICGEASACIRELRAIMLTLRQFREVYRLTVAPDDVLHVDHMDAIIRESGYNPFQAFAPSPSAFMASYQRMLSLSRECMTQLYQAL